jgi:hypothetical protein
VLLAVDFHKDFVNVEGITVSAMLSFNSSGVYISEFDTPEANRFSRHSDAPLGQQIFDEWSGTPAVA